MGFIREQVGRVTIESRRESFVIHMEYENGAWWDFPHPEFDIADLDDLIAALVEFQGTNPTPAPEIRARLTEETDA